MVAVKVEVAFSIRVVVKDGFSREEVLHEAHKQLLEQLERDEGFTNNVIDCYPDTLKPYNSQRDN